MPFATMKIASNGIAIPSHTPFNSPFTNPTMSIGLAPPKIFASLFVTLILSAGERPRTAWRKPTTPARSDSQHRAEHQLRGARLDVRDDRVEQQIDERAA